MGRFYFHVRKGDQLIPDEEGQDLPDASAALHEARLAAQELLAEAVHAGKDNVPDAFVIADEAGRSVATLPLFTVLPKRFRV
jgi:hypothetical protein